MINPDNKELFFNSNYFLDGKNVLIISWFGIFRWDSEKDILVKMSSEKINSAILKDGKLLVATRKNGLKEYYPKTNTFREISIENTGFTFVQDSPKNELLAFEEKKIFKLNIENSKKEEVFSSDDKINDVSYDGETGIFWVSTQNGLVKLWKEKGIVQDLKFSKNDFPVSDIIEDDSANIWFSAGNGNVFKLQKDGTIKNFKIQGKINKLFSDGKSVLIASENGIYEIDDKKLTPKKIISTDFKVKKAISVYGMIWVLPAEGKLKVYDKNSFKEIDNFIKNDDTFYKKNLFNDICISDTKIWLASWMPQNYGISYFDFNSQKFKQISKLYDNNDRFVGDYYNRVNILKNKNVIFSGFGGWNIVSPNGKILKSMNTRVHKIANDNIQGCGEDSAGNIWFGCAEGLYQFNLKTNNSVRISQTDGLASNDITSGFCLAKNDQLYIATAKNVQKIDVKNVLKTELINQLKLTAVKANNEFLQNVSQEIILKEKEAQQLEIYFSALNFSNKEKVVYRYKFDDEKWNYIGTDHKLSLIKLSSGKYNITIEAGDNLGNWQKKSLVLNLKIIPPFYKTFWFFLLLALLFAGIVLAVNRYLVKEEKQKGILKKKIKENETKMLRSQMNPHFLFNSLNSINSYILQNKDEEASYYLTAFSKLMRKILDNSRKENISLKEELETTKLYLDLEAVRMEYKFDYRIQTKDVDTEEIQIPPLILQPFLENAIWHGINHKDTKGLIDIIISKNKEVDGELFIEIIDDGVGRNFAKMKENKQKTHKSHGLEITSERLMMNDARNSVEIIDLYDKNKKPSGTMVKLKIFYTND